MSPLIPKGDEAEYRALLRDFDTPPPPRNVVPLIVALGVLAGMALAAWVSWTVVL